MSAFGKVVLDTSTLCGGPGNHSTPHPARPETRSRIAISVFFIVFPLLVAPVRVRAPQDQLIITNQIRSEAKVSSKVDIRPPALATPRRSGGDPSSQFIIADTRTQNPGQGSNPPGVGCPQSPDARRKAPGFDAALTSGSLEREGSTHRW